MRSTKEIEADFIKLQESRSQIEQEMLRLQGEYRYAYQLEQDKEKKE